MVRVGLGVGLTYALLRMIPRWPQGHVFAVTATGRKAIHDSIVSKAVNAPGRRPIRSVTPTTTIVGSSSVKHALSTMNTNEPKTGRSNEAIPQVTRKVTPNRFPESPYVAERTILRSPLPLRVTENASTKQAKKRRPVPLEDVIDTPLSPGNSYMCTAYCTADRFDMERLVPLLSRRYLVNTVAPEIAITEAVVVKMPETSETKAGGPEDLTVAGGHVFIYKTGCVVAWNVKNDEMDKMAAILTEVEIEPYRTKTEEFVKYAYDRKPTHVRGSDVIFDVNTEVSQHILERYAVSDALALSVKLDVWEDAEDKIIESMHSIPQDMKKGKGMKAGMAFMLQKTGELQLLRHDINLGSNLKSPPDFYWDRPVLESLYLRMCDVSLDVRERTAVINEKLDYSNDLADVLRSYIDQYYMMYTELSIIALITVEVVFECCHWADRFGYIPCLGPR
eukprot:CFRG2124T1